MKLALAALFLHLAITSVYSDILSDYGTFLKNVTNYDEIFAPLADDGEDGLAVVLKMFDASTKFPSGLLAGNFFDLGNFDECYGIEYKELYGKYCLGTIPFSIFEPPQPNVTDPTEVNIFQIHPTPRLVALGTEYIGWHFAVCVPSNISASDIGPFYKEDFCYSKATEKGLSDGAVGTIAFIAVIWAIICVSTVYDVFLYYTKKESRHELLIAFSALSNGRKIFKTTTNPDQLLCLNGIKALSMMWVIIGHEYSQFLTAPASNMLDVQDFQKDPKNMFLNGATVSVDTFFAVGGLVTVYTFMRATRKGEKFNIILFYVHRYLRLTPALLVISLIYMFLLNHFGNGPIWKALDLSLVKPCETGWWSTLLYITNYVQKGSCAPQTWYLSVDMQLFVLSPIVLLFLPKLPKIGLSLLGLLTIAGCIVPFCVFYINNISGMMSDTNFMTLYYIQTYTRFGPYVIGMILGYALYKIRFDGLKFKLRWFEVILLWLILLTGLVACVYAGYPLNVATEPDILGNSFFAAFNRPAWAVVVCGVILLCATGYGGPVDAFLSLPIFQFLTKLSYSMYLVHFAVITIRYCANKNLVTYSHTNLMHGFCGDFMWTLFFSFLLCISFESPIIILEKHLFSLWRKSPPKVAPKTKEQA